MNVKLVQYWPLLFILIIVGIFFYPVWGQGKNAIPADTLTGLYHPYRDVVADAYPSGTPYRNYLITDAVRQQYVYRQFSIEQLKQGQIPWWNPYNFAGTPHLAGFQAATFYPLNILFWFFEFTIAWNMLVMSQPLLGGVFLYMYLRSKGLKKISSIFGGITWIFSGFFIVWLEWNTAVHVALWSPFILWCIDKIVLKSAVKKHNLLMWVILLVFGLVAQFYAGYPQPWLYLSVMQVSYLVWRIVSSKKLKRRKVSIGMAILSYILFLILALPQLNATLELSNLSNRAYDQGNVLEKPDWFIPYPQLIQVIIPDFFGNPASLNYWGVFNYTEFVSFIGVIPAFFVLYWLFRKKKSGETIFFGAVIIVALLFSLRNPIGLLPFLQEWPFLGASQPSRLIVLINLSLAILAGYGFNTFLKTKKGWLLPLSILTSILLGVWIILMLANNLGMVRLAENLTVAKRNTLLPSAELFGLITILIIGHIASQKKILSSKKISLYSAIVFLLITTGVGLRFAKKYTPFTNPEFLYPKSQILTYLKENQGISRYMTTDGMIMTPNTNMAYDLFTIEGYDPIYLESYGRLIYATELGEYPDKSRGYNRTVTTDRIASPIIDILNVKHILTFDELEADKFTFVMQEGITKLYENTQVFPKAFVIDSLEEMLPKSYQSAQVTIYTPNQINIQVQTSKPAYVILSDAWYPRWQAMLNGEQVEVINWFGLRATMVPEGNHEIIYQYSHSYL